MSADEVKNLGNKAFVAKNFNEALKQYTLAIEMSTDSPNHVYYANRGNTYLALEMYQECIQDCDKAIQIDPNYIKSYMRKVKALISLKMFEEARQTVKDGLEVDPDLDDL